MGFLSPLFLLGLLAAAIPVAIHLIKREDPPKLLFGSLRFLKQTSKKLILFQKVQQWLLLLLRSLLICLVVLAFARPLLYQGSLAQLVDAEPESVVILLDTSLSMQFGDRFERAVERAQDVLDGLSSGDEVAVVTFAAGTQETRELSRDLHSQPQFIEELKGPGYGRVRFYPPLQLADDMLARQAIHDQRRVVLISDFQADGLSDDVQGWRLAPGVAFQGIDVGDERSSNLTLTDVRAPMQVMETTDNYEVLARVRSTGSVFQPRANLTLRMNGEVVGQEAVDLGDRSEAVITFPFELEDSGSYRGELRLSDDDFDLDNRWYFTMSVLPPMRVLVINGAPSSDWFDDEAHWFVLALEGMENSPFAVTTTTPSDLSADMLASSDAVVVLNLDTLPAAFVDDMSDFVRQGGAVWFAPGDRVRADAFSRSFAELSPATLQAPNVLGEAEYQLIADMDRRHPALSGLNVDWTARFQGFWQVTPSDEADVLMRFDSGAPMVMERSLGDGHTVLLTTSLDLGWSNFPLQGLYVPFVHEMLRYLIQPPQQQGAWQIGDRIVLDESMLDAQRVSGEELVLTQSDGQQVRIDSQSPYYTASMPGFVEGPDDRTLAVNIEPAAAQLNRVAVATVNDRILNPETTPRASEQVRSAQLIADLEQPQRLWWWILLVAALMLILEAWIANRTYR